jgi:hypothetical protein
VQRGEEQPIAYLPSGGGQSTCRIAARLEIAYRIIRSTALVLSSTLLHMPFYLPTYPPPMGALDRPVVTRTGQLRLLLDLPPLHEQ